MSQKHHTDHQKYKEMVPGSEQEEKGCLGARKSLLFC